MSDPLQELRARLAELADLTSVQMLLEWDQQVMMPSEGAPARAQQLGALARLAHERATAEEIGRWLDRLTEAELGEIDRDVVRLARRDWERARRVPDELAAELARASTDGQESWRAAREQDDFAAFAPALERNVRLAREYASCVAATGRAATRRCSTTTTSASRPHSFAPSSTRSPRPCLRSSRTRACARRGVRSTCPSPPRNAPSRGRSAGSE